MSEEVTSASRSVPLSIFYAYLSNGLIALILLTSYLFALPSVPAALADPTGYPFLYIFRTALPHSGTNALTILLLLLVIASNISYNASTARQTFAFARDHGLPFESWIGAVSSARRIPINSIALTGIITVLLSLINVGSNVAFNAIISLQVVAIMLTYTISVCVPLSVQPLHCSRMDLAYFLFQIPS